MNPLREDLPPLFTVRRMCDKNGCKRPAYAAKHLSYHTLQFCSVKHRNSIARPLQERELDRLDGLLNKLFLLESKWLHPLHTCGARRMEGGSLLLLQQDEPTALAEQESTTGDLPQVFRKIGHSFNACVHAMEVLTGLLAFFAEGTYPTFVL